MERFNKFFGKSDPTDILVESVFKICNEMERVYRNHLELTPSHGAITGIGLFKARLFAATFVHTAYLLGCKHGIDDVTEFMRVCSDMAMSPFLRPGFLPSVNREQAASLATEFMLKVSRLLRKAIETNPNHPSQHTSSFAHLVGIYHECLAESCSAGTYTQSVCNALNKHAEGVVLTMSRMMADQMEVLYSQ